LDASAAAPFFEAVESVFFADEGGLGSIDRMKVSVWKSENVANGMRVRGMGDYK